MTPDFLAGSNYNCKCNKKKKSTYKLSIFVKMMRVMMRVMKVLILFLFFILSLTASAQNVYYVQDTSDNANASDSNAGTDINYPWATWQHAFDEAMPGDTVYFRGSTWMMNNVIVHRPSSGHGNQGTYSAHICFFNYPGETPVIDFSNYTAPWGRSGVTFEDPQYIELRGFIIENLAQPSDVQMEGLVVEHVGAPGKGNYAIAWFTNIEVRNIGGAGIYVMGADTLVLTNCDSHDNFDPYTSTPGNHADGFTLTAGGYPTDTTKVLIIDGCRAWNNGDDGFDFPFGQQVYFSNTWVWNNGHEGDANIGVKPSVAWVVTNGKRVVKNCISAYNTGAAFGNLNLDDPYFGPRIAYYNNVSYKDAGGFSTSGFPWDAKTGIGGLWMYNNIIYNPKDYVILVSGDLATQARYIKDGYNNYIRQDPWPYSYNNPAYNITDADFVSLDTAELRWPRKADGSLPDINFMKLVAGSDLIDGGCDVGLPYKGAAPDVGWYEYPSAVANGLYASAGSDQIKTDIDGSGNEMVTLDGSGSEDDGNITSYVWTRNGSQIATGVNPKVSIPVGHNDIVLTVTDNDSNTATDTVNIWVQDEYTNQIPVANGGSNRTVYAPEGEDTATVHLDASASYDPDGTIVYYSWTYFDYHGDHSTHYIKNDAGTTFEWRAPVDSEPYQVRLQVVDNNLASVIDTVWITVSSSGSNTPPTANAGADQTVNDSDNSGAENVTLDGSNSVAGSGSIKSYVWTEESSQIATGIKPTVSFDVGTHNVMLTVTDDSGNSASDSVTITVTPYVATRGIEITNYSPNPTSDIVTVVFYSPVTGTINIKVVSNSGVEVLSTTHNATEGENNQVDIDLSGLTTGVYTITLNDGKSSDACSVTKQDAIPPRPLEIISSTSETFDIFTVSFYSPGATNISIEFFNSSGNSVKNITYPASEGNNKTSLDISDLPEGEYRVTLYDGTTSTDCYVTKKEKETILFGLVEASPDPTVDLFEIKFNNPSSGTIHAEVFNDAGKKVWEDNFNVEKGLNKSIVLNLSSLDPGNYKVTVDNGKDPELTTTVTRQAYINE